LLDKNQLTYRTSEVAPAQKRGLFVVMNHIGLTTGIAVAFWYVVFSGKGIKCLTDHWCRVGYAVTFWDTPEGKNIGWRFSIALQFVPAVIFFAGLPFLVET
jgi:hypothetical protein